MANLTDQIKQAFNALGMANAGEVSGRYRMEAALRFGPVTPTPTPLGQGRRLVALGVGSTLPIPVLNYAARSCHRLQADLLLLTTDPLGLHEQLSQHRTLLEGIVGEAEALDAVNRRAVLRVLARHPRLLFAISGTPDDPVRCLVAGKRRLFAGPSPVPVVLVGNPGGPAPDPIAAQHPPISPPPFRHFRS
jgi:hypothetical protein